MQYSVGVSLDASGGAISAQEVFRVPVGHKAKVTMFFMSNVGGSTTTVGASWHDGATIPFLGAKSLSSGDHVQFGGGSGLYMMMAEDDYITVDVASGGECSLIVSYELIRVDSQ